MLNSAPLQKSNFLFIWAENRYFRQKKENALRYGKDVEIFDNRMPDQLRESQKVCSSLKSDTEL